MVRLLVFFIVIGGVLVLFQTLFNIQNPNSASASNNAGSSSGGLPQVPGALSPLTPGFNNVVIPGATNVVRAVPTVAM